MSTLDLATIRLLPKVALHDHLDGGVRVATVLDIARRIGHEVPADTAETLADWFFDAADSGSLERYLSTFSHTIAVMQTADDLTRIAREFVEDMAADGVVYAETRWAPEQHLRQGLSLDRAVEAVQTGLDEGMALVRDQGTPVMARQILSGMRQAGRTREIAELAIAHRDHGVAGFDIAGPEAGFPASDHRDAFALVRAENGSVTIHAGEADGPESIHAALQICGAHRLGHGVRIIEDIKRGDDGWQLGRIAAYVRDHRIPLEVCPTSNRQTGIAASYAEHPVGLLEELGFTITLSCDNRLMSRTTLSEEFLHLHEAFGFDIDVLGAWTVNGLDAAFWNLGDRQALLRVVMDAYA